MGEQDTGDTVAAVAELSSTGEAFVPAPPNLVWAVAGDSNRWDRVIRTGPSAYTSELVDGQTQHQQVGHGKFAGVALSWLERGEWMEGEFMVGERRYLSGPLSVAGFRVDVAGEGAGTRVTLRSYLTPVQELPSEFSASIVKNLERAIASYLQALTELFTDANIPAQQQAEPASTYGARVLSTLSPHKVLDRVQPVSETDFTECAKRLSKLPIEQDHQQRILDYVRLRTDLELEQIRPFALARQWQTRRRPLLRSFLHASTAGLLDLRWQLNCPQCRVGAEVVDQLASIQKHTHCDSCDTDFEIDFADNVEAVFRPNPAVRKIDQRVYCASSPWFRPHIYGAIELKANQTKRIPVLPVDDGFIVRTLLGHRAIELAQCPGRIVVSGHQLDAEPAQDDSHELELVNATERVCSLLFERRGTNTNATHGTDILTLPEFLDLYGAEAPASGVDLTIGRVVVLFSDLTNTTAAYRNLGDARAFALIHQHFRDMGRIVGEHSGAVLKTMGDAVMASFVRPADAVEAGLAMIDATRNRHGSHGFHLKVGIHDGPCVMVRANERMDLFGTTVNMASRLQEQASADQLVMMSSALEVAEVSRVLAAHGLTAAMKQGGLKGLGDGHNFAIITLPPQPQ